MRRLSCLTGVLLAAALAGGCVERSFVVETNPPSALVLVNNKPIGGSPADGTWEYYGRYHITLMKEGYETLHVDQDIPAPWYEYVPLDFFFENVWPFKLRDHRRFAYEMQPARVPDVSEVRERSENLRNHGRALRSEAPAPVAPAPPPTAELGAPVMPREP